MENVNMIDLTNLIEAALEALLLVVAVYLIPWIKAKLNNEQEAKLRGLFEVAVYAAEKIYGAKKGDEKLKFVERYLESRGIRVDTMRLRAYVNAEIKKMEQREDGGVTIVENINGAFSTEEDSSCEEDDETVCDEIPDEEDAQEEA